MNARPTARRPKRPSGPGRGGGQSRTPLVVIGVAVLIGLALVVALLAGGDDDDTTTAGEAPALSADALPPLPQRGGDPAVGQAMPTLRGTSQDGEPMTIAADGRAKMIVFLAHWCPHCQREVPVVQKWVDEGNLPDDVDLLSVSTAIDSRRPNYPPDEWLEREGWTSPVLVDEDNSVAQTAGLTAYPFFVAVDRDGRVALRTSGELTAGDLDQIVDMLQEDTS